MKNKLTKLLSLLFVMSLFVGCTANGDDVASPSAPTADNQDVDSLVYWSNEAAYRWNVRGIAIWSLGQEDMRLWEALPRQI